MLKFAKRKSVVSEDSSPSTNPEFFAANTEDGECQTKEQLIDSKKCETSDKTCSENTPDDNLLVEVATYSMAAPFTKNVEENAAYDSPKSIGGNSQETNENFDPENVCEDFEKSQRHSIFEPQANSQQSTRVHQENLMSRIKHVQTMQAGIENDLEVTAIFHSLDNSPSPILSSTESVSAEGSLLSDYLKSLGLLADLCLSKSRTSWFAFKTYLKGCRSLKSLIDGAICYVICFILCLICLVIGINVEQHQDAPFCVMAVTMWCCLVTLTLERGFFTRWLDQQVMRTSSFNEDIYDYSMSSYQWCLCCNQEIQLENRSQYARPHKASSTAFICEVSDVANMNVGECPQIKEVESEGIINNSFDNSSPRPIRTVRAVVHRSESEDERPLPGCELGCEGACACPSLNAKLKSPKKANLVCRRCGHYVPCACKKRKVTAC